MNENKCQGTVRVCSFYGSTFVSIADNQGDVVSWDHFITDRQSLTVAKTFVEKVIEIAVKKGIYAVTLRVKGPGCGREIVTQVLQAAGIEITMIQDITPITHNGCRPLKSRRYT